MKNFLLKYTNNSTNRRVFSAIIFGTGGAIISKGLLMLFNIIIARILNANEYGIYSIVNNTVQTFTIFAGAGLGATMSRYVALYREKNKKLAGIFIKTLIIFNIIAAILISCLMFFYASLISNIISKEVDISVYLRITSFTIFFTSISLVFQNVLQGFEKYKNIAFFQLLSNILMLLVGIILTKYLKTTGSILSLLILNIFLFISFFISIKKILKEYKIKTKFEINNDIKEAIIKVAIPALLSSLFVVPIVWITNSIFIKNHGYDEYAAFSVCLQWFTILNYIPQQLGQAKPIYTQLFDDNNIVEFKRISFRMMIFSVTFTLLAALILSIGSPLLLKTYGSFYTSIRLSFIIMLISAVVYSVQSQFGSIFYAIGKIWLSFVLNVIWAAIYIICFNLFLKQGVFGYALTYLLSYIFYAIISTICFYITIKKRNEVIKWKKLK